MGKRTAFIAEEIDHVVRRADLDVGGAGETWLLGRFCAHVEDVDDPALADTLDGPATISEAIAWALPRADGVLIRDGDEQHYGLGAVLDTSADDDEDDPILPWREELAATFVRRRARGERWKDRLPTDAPVAWAVTVTLMLEQEGADGVIGEPDAVDAEVAAIVAAWEPDAWSGEEVAAYRAAHRAAQRSAGRGGGFFVGGGLPVWRLSYRTVAPTADSAAEAIRDRLDPPPGWTALVAAEPATA
jgi:hypothetical protein